MPAGTGERRVTVLGVAALVVLGALAGCASTDERPVPAASCEPAPEHATLIAERLMGGATELGGARAVRLRPPVGQYVYVVAARVHDQIGVWAVGPWRGGARILAVDQVAREWSEWGAAISDDSAAGRQRAQLAVRREVVQVRACVTESRP